MTETTLSPAKQALLERRLGRRTPAATIPRRDENTPLPLSYAQERLWFMEQYAPGTAAYVVPMALHLRGPLDPAAVSTALDAVVARHDSLRLRVTASEEGRPHAHTAAPAPVDVTLVTLPEGLEPAEREERTRQLVSEESGRPFDLAAGPLLRAALIRRDTDDHVLVVCVHHIAADGWSTGLLLGELAEHYDAAVTGDRPSWSEPEVRYGDYAAWQRERIGSGAGATDLAYWREHLAGLPPLELPTDHPRPARPAYAGAGHSFRIDPVPTAAIARLADSLGATPYMVILAAFQVVLSRHSGQTDFAVGSPVAGRVRPELEPLIGMFANVLALRADLSVDPAFRDLVVRVRDRALDAYSHQDVPFEHIVTELKVTRDTSRSPIFQVALAMQNYSRAARSLHGGVTVSWFVVDAVATRFDLEVYLYEYDDSLSGFVTYDTALFERPTVERLMKHLVTVLDHAVSEPDTRTAELRLHSAADEQAVLAAARGPVVDVPASTLLDLLEHQARRTPDAVAIATELGTHTYARLHSRANQLAHHLVALGAGPDGRVAICARRGFDLIVGILAILKSGAAYVPLDPGYPAQRLAYMLSDSGAGLLLRHSDASFGPDGILLDDDTDWHDYPTDPPTVGVRPSDAAYAIYTSGSTGRPKGAVNSHRAIVNRLDWMQRTFRLDETDAVLHKTPISFDVSVWELLWPLICGARLVMARPGGHRDPAYLAEIIAGQRITTVHFVPSMLSVFLTDNEVVVQCSTLRRIVCSGEELPRTLARRCAAALPNGELFNLYGPTEAAIDVSWWRCDPDEVASRVPIGRPIQNVDLYVLDRRGRPQPPGVPGELCIAGAGLGDGYLGRASLTAQRFLPHPYGPPGSRLYRTGDRAIVTSGSTIVYCGRYDDQVKLRGVRIELGEIENVLRESPGVSDAAVALREDVPGDQRLVAYVVGDADPLHLRGRLRQTLPDQLIPAAIVPIPALPLSPSGKVDRRALPAPVKTAVPTTAPASAAEQLIADVYAEVLGVAEVGRDDDFFDLGGHSLLAVQVIARLKRPLAGAGLAPLSVMDLFRAPTVRGLAEVASRAGAEPVMLLHELRPRTRATAYAHTSLVCIPYGGGSAVVYQPLADALGPGYRLFSLALPGHDLGTADQARPMADVVPAVVTEILQRVPSPVIVYGHCGVGSAYALATAMGLQAAGHPPTAVYIGAMFPFARPHGRLAGLLARLADRERLLSDRVFASWLTGMGVDLSGLDQQEIRSVVRAMRRDSIEAENYFTTLYADPPALDAPIISVVGDRDPAADLYRERYTEWLAFTDSAAVVALDEGGHYFVNHRAAEVAEIVSTSHVALAAGTLRSTADSPARTWHVRGVSSPGAPPVQREGPPPSLGRFAAVATSQLVSILGSALTEFAVPLWLYTKTGSLLSFAMLATLGLVPGLLALPLAGAIVDRTDRRRVMLLADCCAGGIQIVMIALLLAGGLGLSAVCVMIASLSVALTFQRLAYASAVAQLVPKRYLGHANGLVQMSGGMAQLVVPVIAVAALAWFGLTGILVLDVASYLVSVATLMLVRFPATLAHSRRETLMAEIRNGMRYSLGRTGIRAMLFYFALLNVFLSPLLLLLSPLAMTLGGLSTAGHVAVAAGAGAFAGGLAVGVWGGPRTDRMRGMLLCAAALGLAGVLTGLRPSVPLIAAGAFGLLFLLSAVNGVYATIVQTKVPQRFHGRVFALNTLIAWSTIPLGFAVIAPLATHLGERWMHSGGWTADTFGRVIGAGEGRGIALVYVVFGIGIALLSTAALRHPVLASFDARTPDAEPDDLVGLRALQDSPVPRRSSKG